MGYLGPVGYQLVGTTSMTDQNLVLPIADLDRTPPSQKNSTADYFAIEGVYYGVGSNGFCVNVDNGTIHGCPHFYGPEIDQLANLNYPLPLLPEKILLALADLNKVEAVSSNPSSSLSTHNLIWLPRTASTASKQTTYTHKTRCGDSEGEHVETDNNAYKKCAGGKTHMRLKNQFHLPPNVCKTTCDEQTDCVGYTIDTTGANCWILWFGTTTPGTAETEGAAAVYWLIGPASN
jgi:hypothetical protein